MKYAVFLFFLVSMVIPSFSWTQTVLSFDRFMNLVKTYHPIAAQANLRLEVGEAAVRASRGGFDPQLFTDLGQKYFDNDQYYSILDAGLKVPTWFGVELYTGYEQTTGVNLNPERKTPNAGLVYAGISLPVGQGLFMDQRRADLRQAQLFESITKEEQRIHLNNLLLRAGDAYWDWFTSYEVVSVFDDALRLAEERFEGVRQNALLGDVAIIDTVEAFIQVQQRRIGLQEARLQFQNQSERLSVFLWGDGAVPLELEEGVLPQSEEDTRKFIMNEFAQEEIDSLISSHPLISKNQLFLKQLDIERRLKAEQLKPVFNLKYNAINEAISDNIITGYSINNYNWGLQFHMPIFVRRGRGELKLTKLKIQDAELDLSHDLAEIEMLVNTALNTWRTSTTQVSLYSDAVDGMDELLRGERRKFEVGESSLFLVNAREESYISGRIELAQMIAKNQKSIQDISFQLGVLYDLY